MCGITGFFEAAGDFSEQGRSRRTLLRMRDALAHRGPDEEGLCFAPEMKVALGHRRLSIIDLSSGQQPMTDLAGRASIVFNGEIYNFKALRDELASAGAVFRTHSDTEVLLSGYLHWGVHELVAKLNGMFAFAVLDRKERVLHLARDLIGEKPLFYSKKPGLFAFASEARALLAHPSVSRSTSIGLVQDFLSHDYMPADRSIWSDLRKLQPGHVLTFDIEKQELALAEFPSRPVPEVPASSAEAEAIASGLLEDSVRLRLVSDVPIGLFLSGGIDSTLVLAAASRIRDPGGIRTFSISFREADYDESKYSALAARHFGTRHQDFVFSSDEMLAIVPSLLCKMDEPFGDASLLPTYFLCEAARNEITVALSGDGGDELFAGYDTFKALQLKRLLDRAPRALTSGLALLAKRIPPSDRHLGLGFKARQLLKGANVPLWLAVGRWMASIDFLEQKALFKVPLERIDEEAFYSDYKRASEAFDAAPSIDRHPITHLALIYQQTYLVNDILVKSDRASMLRSLEVRPPLLDRRLVEFANHLSYSYKMRGLDTKAMLKQLLRAYGAPPVIAKRGKKGFAVPVAAWLRGPLREYASRYFSRAFVEAQGLFVPEAVDRLFQQHLSGKANHRKALWTLLCFQVWWDTFRPDCDS